MKSKQIIAQELHSTEGALRKVDFKCGQVYQGQGILPLSIFTRLLEEIESTQNPKQNQLSWKFLSWKDEMPAGDQAYRIKLDLKSSVHLVCQRCLNPFLHKIEISSQFVMLHSEQEVDDFPIENDLEDALLSSHEFNLIDLFEDELILALPIVPKHAPKDCENAFITFDDEIELLSEDPSKNEPKTEKINPFLQLKKLKLN